MIDQKDYEELWHYIQEVQIGMLVSMRDTELRARPMALVQDDFTGKLYFFTNRNAGKVDEIQQDSDVCVAFERPEEDVYVSCSGTARFIKDDALINTFWNPFVAAWFPEGKDSAEIGLLEVNVYKAEIWDADASKMVQLYQIARANLTDEPPHMGKNKKFG